jgi:hypothetical protein
MGQIIQTKKAEVKKHVAAIHCSNTLSLLQRKISNALLYHAYPELLGQEEHEITVKQLCNIIGYNGNNHAVIKEALKGLIATLIEWNVIDNVTGEEDWSASTILASVRIKGSHCSYAYSPRMRELLYSPSMYGKINLIIQARFKSNYGLALYENCIRYKGLPYTKLFEFEAFRKLMGVPEQTYPIFRDFKKRVLDKSIEEVNTYSDLRIEPEINRVDYSPSELALVTKLKVDFGFSTSQIETLRESYSDDVIVEKIKLIESSKSYLAGKVNNLAAYLSRSLKEDYQSPKSSSDTLHIIKNEKEQLEVAKKQAARLEEEQRQKYSEYMAEQYDQAIDKLGEEQLKELKIFFEVFLKEQNNTFITQKYLKNGLENKICKLFFRNFIKEKYVTLLPSIFTFEQFLANT